MEGTRRRARGQEAGRGSRVLRQLMPPATRSILLFRYRGKGLVARMEGNFVAGMSTTEKPHRLLKLICARNQTFSRTFISLAKAETSLKWRGKHANWNMYWPKNTSISKVKTDG